MFKAFVYFSHFQYLRKKRQKAAKIFIFIATNFVQISSFTFTFKWWFFGMSFLKNKLCHLYTSYVYLEAVL